MASRAFQRWKGERSDRLDELASAHRLVGGTGRGRRWRTAGLNEALVLRLAAEFQAYARELHDQASDQFVAWVAPGSTPVQGVVRRRLTESRQLDRGNAQPSSLGSDFGRLGFELWPALSARDKAIAKRHNDSLERLNRARNALAHGEDAPLATLRAEGFALVLTTFKVWRRDIDGLAANLDFEVADQLGRLFGQPSPW